MPHCVTRAAPEHRGGRGLATGHLPLASVRRHVVFDSELPDACFALVVSDNSMAPVLGQGDIALVDPEKPARQGDLVLAAVVDCSDPNRAVETVTIRQISFLMQMAAPPLILVPVSPDWPIRRISSRSEGRILGVVVTLIRALGAGGMEVVESNRPML